MRFGAVPLSVPWLGFAVTWKNLVLGKLDPEEAVSGGSVEISGADPEEFYAFMDLFK